ncbi:hypothetical protein AB0C07_28145 [Actinoplanes missouriensis]|uniref:hypothetical protein n=1 Tax=Actinoplanes missouriensis TaxID=1866 RepID=UPI0033ECC37F
MAWEWVAPAVTGTVGLFTILLARKTLRVQHERALAAERRGLYGKFLGALREVEHCDIRVASTEDLDETLSQSAVQAYRDARTRASALLAEISIVAPPSVERAAKAYYDAAVLKPSESAAPLRLALTEAMRADIA